MKKRKVVKKSNKKIDWSKTIKVSKQLQQVEDFKRVREMVKEIYDIFKRHGVYK